MKKFTKLAAIAMTLALASPCPAQSIMGAQASRNEETAVHNFRYYNVPGMDNKYEVSAPKGYEKVTKNGITTFVKKNDKAGKQKSQKAEGELIAVKCIFDCDMEEWFPNMVLAYNKTSHETGYYDWENNFVTMYLEPGTYDFMIDYSKTDPTSIFWSSYNAWVIKEGVEVTEETALSFDPNAATNHISMRSYNPNGEPTRLRRIKYTVDGFEVLDEGNVDDVWMVKYLIHQDYGMPYMYSTNLAGAEVELNPDFPELGQLKSEEWRGDIYVNDVSDKYMFQQLRVMPTDDETYMTSIRAKCGDTQSVTNDYTKYGDAIQFNHINSPAREKYQDVYERGDYGIHYFCTYNNELPNSWPALHSSDNTIHKIRFCPPSTVPEYDNIINYGLYFSYVDACTSDTIDYGNGNIRIKQTAYNVTSQNIFPQANGNEYNYSQYQTWFDAPATGELRYATGARGLNFDYSNTDLEAGATCPIAVSTYFDISMEGFFIPYIGTIYKGQMGELRDVDNLDAALLLKADDEVIATNAEELNNWMYSGQAPTMLTLSMTNRNFEVDGIEGFNDMVCVVDQNKEDRSTPSLTALQFRQNDGFVTNRFESAEAGTMVIMCGNFKVQFDENFNTWFNYGDCDVTVEYAPNGTDDFAPVAMTKDDSKFHMPGYGAYYSTSLAAFTAQSENGWYDLRITLRNEAGNYQQQVISPAVNIRQSHTGISAVTTSNDATEVARYTIDGRAISAPQAGVNIVKISDGTVKKVLVK